MNQFWKPPPFWNLQLFLDTCELQQHISTSREELLYHNEDLSRSPLGLGSVRPSPHHHHHANSPVALTLAPSASATVQQICSGGRANICLSVGINNARTLYLQIKAPASNGWAAIGTGSRMVGSKIFVLYRNTRGGLTVSPREAG